MSYTDPITEAQVNYLYQQLHGEISVIKLIAWGIERQDKGETMYLNTRLWSKGNFSKLIDLVLKNKLDGIRQIYNELTSDFINYYTKEIEKS